MSKIVCRCNMVTEKDVKTFFELYPYMPKDQAKHALNIGTRCSGCQKPNNTLVDITYEQIINADD